MSALAVLARIPYPMRFHPDVAGATEWLHATLGAGTGLPDVESLRRAALALQADRAGRRVASGL
jgi:hypothetical protein